jgi:hypothetical protein
LSRDAPWGVFGDQAFSYGQYPWGPGEVLRYHGINTFVLAAAMDSFLKRQVGRQAHLWEMVVAEVFRPIGVFHLPTLHTQEADGGRGIPHLEAGLYPTIEDVAKLTTLLQHGGQHQGQQILHAGKRAEALYKANAMGLPNNSMKNRFGEGRYNLSFWSVPYRTATGCFFQIPNMSGWGGNVVGLLPNGISAFRFADGDHYDVDTMVLAGEAIRPFPCPSISGEAPAVRQPLTASAMRAELPGYTFYTGPMNIFIAANGVLYGTVKRGPDGASEQDVGTWHITPDGQWCRAWRWWDHRRERCHIVYREGETSNCPSKTDFSI